MSSEQKYYKAINMQGRDFYSDTVQWAPVKSKARKGRVVKHPDPKEMERGNHATGLAASLDPTDYPGAGPGPLRVLQVEPVGDVITVEKKAMALAWRVVGEIDPSIRFGPNGVHVAALVERAGQLTADDATALHAARHAARDAARDAAWDAARHAARHAAWDAAWYAAGDAAWYAARHAAWHAAWYAAWHAAGALSIRDQIGFHGFTQEHYDTLTMPWRKALGRIHPDDAEM